MDCTQKEEVVRLVGCIIKGEDKVFLKKCPLIQRDGLWENFVPTSECIHSGKNKENHRGKHKRQNDVVSSWCPP